MNFNAAALDQPAPAPVFPGPLDVVVATERRQSHEVLRRRHDGQPASINSSAELLHATLNVRRPRLGCGHSNIPSQSVHGSAARSIR